MTGVLRGSATSTLAEVCVATVLDPEVVLGLVDVDIALDGAPEDLTDRLRLHEVASSLNAAWRDHGYAGELTAFAYSNSRLGPRGPHIDHKYGWGANAPQRAVVLSLPVHGVARVLARQYDSVLRPGTVCDYGESLQAMRLEAATLASEDLPISLEHQPGQVLVIPTLPRPTAHAVEVTVEPRLTHLWDSVHVATKA